MTTKNIAICLFRNDLRLHDNLTLLNSCKNQSTTHVIPLYVFDPNFIDTSSAQSSSPLPKTYYNNLPRGSQNRNKFIVESVLNLRSNLRIAGSNLLIEFGKPEEIVKNIVETLLGEKHIVSGFYYAREFTPEEIQVETNIAHAVKIPMFKYYTSTLVLPQDLPFSIDRLPDVYSNFRTKIEKVRLEVAKDPVSTVTKMKPFPELSFARVDMSDEDIMARMKINNIPHDPRTAFPFKGGETAGLARVKDYYWGTKAVKTYKDTRNGMIGDRYSTKFSPWLANGCISPRTVISLLSEFEEEHGANKDTYWVWFELLWREYFKFVALKFKSQLFAKSGLMSNAPISWIPNKINAEAWMNGMTGIPFVDANMRELKATGFMSNRGRQNVASFLTKDIQLDWTIGAEWFESQLMDHDPCSNYGNWLYTAGLGNDPRGEDRHFNMIKQAKDYDSNGDYVKLWCPELAAIPADAIHTPWKMSQEQQKYYGCIIGKDYPKPIKVMSVWEKHSSRPVGASNKSTENTKERIYPDKKMSKNRQKTLDEYQKGTSSSAGGGWSKK